MLALGVAVLVTLLGIGALGAVGYVVSIAASAPSLDSLKPINKGATSVVFAADGSRLGFIQANDLRTPVRAQDIPQSVRDATVAIEDQRFYEHSGVDYEGILRAAYRNVTSGRTLQGGSTITMQLVRHLYISPERTLSRKIREARLAQQLEQRHPGHAGKVWILTNYLNTVPYGTVGGQSAIGIDAAARLYFDKPVSQLTLPEAALLSGLPQAPSAYNPFINPDGARLRRNDVLKKMADLHYVTPEQAARAMASPLGVRHNAYYTTRREGYFFDYVQQELINRYGADRVRQGGLKIYTTIDLKFQDAARKAIAGQLTQPGDPSSAVVSIDPANGYIRAMASSANYGQSKFNLAAQGHRQPGSTFKAMVLMTAVRKGIDPQSTTYESKPLDFVDPRYGPIKVQTYSHSYLGNINLVDATLKSDNTVYQQLDLDVGPKDVAQTAHDMGITTHLDGYPSEGLGGLTIGVSPLEMANAYATIASGGWRNTPTAFTKVQFPDGHSDDLSKPQRVKAFSDGVTSTVSDILQKNIQMGTGVAANIGCPAGGKTGTTDNFTDAWFDGFTPHLATAVWVGYPKSKVPMTDVHGIQVAGGTFPAMIWHDYMQVAHGSDCSGFPAPQSPVSFSPFFSTRAGSGSGSGSNGSGSNGSGSNGSGSGYGGSNTATGSGSGRGKASGAGGIGNPVDNPPGQHRTVSPTTGGGTSHHTYNPQFYASPPQTAPRSSGGGGGGTGGAGAGPAH